MLQQSSQKLILYSPKHSLLLEQFHNELSPEGSGIRHLCPKRWTVRTGTIDAVLRNYPAIIEILAKVSEESYDDYGRRSNGLLCQLERFETIFVLKLSYLIFSGTEQITLQRKDTSVQDALMCAELCGSYLRRTRKDDTF